MTYQELKKAIELKGYKWFDGNKPFNLNIIGVRTSYEVTDTFKDKLYIAYKDSKMVEQVMELDCTTIAGKYYFKNLFNPRGTAIVIPDQYLGAFTLGLHRGLPALVQVKALRFWRDKNKDYFINKDVFEQGVDNNLNIHRASNKTISKVVHNWSAGCTVCNDPRKFDRFIELCQSAIRVFLTNSFTYTLIEKSDLDRVKIVA
jgi:hypothetical protein